MQTSELKKHFKNLDIIFLAIIGSQLFLFFSFLFLSNQIEFTFDYFSNDELQIIAIIFNTIIILLSKFIQKVFIKNNSSEKPVEEIVSIFRNYSIIRLALLEFGNTVNIVFYIMSGNNIFLLIFGALFILQFAYRPLPKLLIKEFNLPLEKLNAIL